MSQDHAPSTELQSLPSGSRYPPHPGMRKKSRPGAGGLEELGVEVVPFKGGRTGRRLSKKFTVWHTQEILGVQWTAHGACGVDRADA